MKLLLISLTTAISLFFALLSLADARGKIHTLEQSKIKEKARVEKLIKNYKDQFESLYKENQALSIMQCSGVGE